ncbi:MAG TPA: MerR family transcriptional regulator [Solirubrobacteraceae bacterium]|nr:MerR family transcriptional regulator [Solirubrobacteraceae bacterium]
MADEPGSLRIGEFARRTGVSTELLRAWERRYGLLRPLRSAGGYRLYTPADIQRVSRMRQAIESGLSAAEAARFALDAGGPELDGQGDRGGSEGLERGIARLIAAVGEFDEAQVQEVLDESLAAFGLAPFLTRLVLPALAQIGTRWEAGELDIAHEHFASTVIRARLLGLARLWGRGHGPLALLACPPDEAHDIGLICFGLLLRSHGWRILFLGADTPVDTVAQAARMTRPAVIVMASLSAEPLECAAEPLGELGRAGALALAGPGAGRTLCRRLGARWLGPDLPGAVGRLAEPASAGPA